MVFGPVDFLDLVGLQLDELLLPWVVGELEGVSGSGLDFFLADVVFGPVDFLDLVGLQLDEPGEPGWLCPGAVRECCVEHLSLLPLELFIGEGGELFGQLVLSALVFFLDVADFRYGPVLGLGAVYVVEDGVLRFLEGAIRPSGSRANRRARSMGWL